MADEFGSAAAGPFEIFRCTIVGGGAGEACAVLGEVEGALAGIEGFVGEFEFVAGGSAFDRRAAAEGEMPADVIAGLIQFHQAQIGEPEAEKGREFFVGGGGASGGCQ